MTEKKSPLKKKGKPSPVRAAEGHPSPQTELLEKSMHNPSLGRKPAKQATAPPAPSKPNKAAKSTEQEALGSTTTRVNERRPKHQKLDSSGQDTSR